MTKFCFEFFCSRISICCCHWSISSHHLVLVLVFSNAYWKVAHHNHVPSLLRYQGVGEWAILNCHVTPKHRLWPKFTSCVEGGRWYCTSSPPWQTTVLLSVCAELSTEIWHTCLSIATIGWRYISCCSSCSFGRGKFAVGTQLVLGHMAMCQCKIDNRSSCGCGDMLIGIYVVADIWLLTLHKCGSCCPVMCMGVMMLCG